MGPIGVPRGIQNVGQVSRSSLQTRIYRNFLQVYRDTLRTFRHTTQHTVKEEMIILRILHAMGQHSSACNYADVFLSQGVDACQPTKFIKITTLISNTTYS